VLYLTSGDELGPGQVYQVDFHGLAIGRIGLPLAGTGIALERDKALVLAVPRDGGHILRIDSAGSVSTLLENSKILVHPIDVAVAAGSDTVVVSDNLSNLLATVIDSDRMAVFRRFAQREATAENMSVAVTDDRHIILGTDARPGVYRFESDKPPAAGEAAPRAKQLLPASGGVAAELHGPRWAAAQAPDQLFVFRGEKLEKRLALPAGNSLYGVGLLAFSPDGELCVTAHEKGRAANAVSMVMLNLEREDARTLFVWTKEHINDFVIGPPMPWDRRLTPYRSTY
jgi:hypothetical protein